MTARVGAPAPSAGQPLLTGPKKATSAKLEALNGRDVSKPGEPEGWVISLGSASVPYTGDPSAPVTDLKLIHLLTKDTPETLQVVLQRRSPLKAWTVPLSSVFGGSGDQHCIIARSTANPSSEKVVGITIVGGSLGSTKVTGDIQGDVEILAHPSLTRAGLQCE